MLRADNNQDEKDAHAVRLKMPSPKDPSSDLQLLSPVTSRAAGMLEVTAWLAIGQRNCLGLFSCRGGLSRTHNEGLVLNTLSLKIGIGATMKMEARSWIGGLLFRKVLPAWGFILHATPTWQPHLSVGSLTSTGFARVNLGTPASSFLHIGHTFTSKKKIGTFRFY